MKEVVTFEPPKTLYINFWGKLSQEHVNELFEKWTGFVKHEDEVDILIDVSELEGVSPEARKLLRTKGSQFRISCMSIFGASAKMQVMGGLILKMLPNVDRSKFFKIRDEAITWMKNG